MFYHRTRSYSKNCCFKEAAFFQQKNCHRHKLFACVGLTFGVLNDEHGHISGVSFSKGKGAESLLKLVELFNQNREALTNGVQYIDMDGHEINPVF